MSREIWEAVKRTIIKERYHAKATKSLSLPGCHAVLPLCLPLCTARVFCGEDAHSGQSYEHRRAWIEERMRKLAGVFAIDLCAYAVRGTTRTPTRILAISSEIWEAVKRTIIKERYHANAKKSLSLPGCDAVLSLCLRCVRRVSLREDAQSGQSYEHRRAWIEERMRKLAEAFAVDLCAYAVMSNHYHVVLHIDAARAQSWDALEVIRRWQLLFVGHPLAKQFARGEAISKAERKVVDELIAQWRSRLMDISWYMRCLNESIARQANAEDGCRGRFWEGRFKSQALLDEKALAACLAYVDLNPIRAGIAETPEDSEYTSIRKRVAAARSGENVARQPEHLMPFAGNPRRDMPKGLPFRLNDYLELADWTGKMLRDDKRSAIPGHLPPLLERLQIDTSHWLHMSQHFESRFKGIVGSIYRLKAACQKLGYKRTPNLSVCRQIFA